MPNKNMFENNEEYLKWYQEYRDKNRLKIREYNKRYNKEYRRDLGYLNEEKWKEKNPQKVKAHKLLHYAIRCGIIKRKNCEVCKSTKSQGHHPDYSKPLEVIWLCALHHKEQHKNLTKL